MHAPRARAEIISVRLDFMVIALRLLYFSFYEVLSHFHFPFLFAINHKKKK